MVHQVVMVDKWRNGGSGNYDGAGGSGTGEDTTAYDLTHFTLSPGEGGQARPGES